MILITQQIQKKKKRHNFNSRLIEMVSAKNPTQNFSGKKKLFIVFSSLYADVLIHYKTQKKEKKNILDSFLSENTSTRFFPKNII